ncbi:hypothetical protein JYU34_014238 [Plutella xylostella]|uniref:Uncharacterized protein n=2 Tax=Plutella xylostella TaxID=51655 RepID=A0ABQ7Q8V2_PLUXY|nr:protein wech [Plutella xylostella]KAG7301308.1 hypothetical protein JYU34_014238 [Plutella xylostella]CAG9127350.1 unnamed protein product [Plutella xylostella]
MPFISSLSSAASAASTTTTTAAATSSRHEEPLAMSRLISNLIDAMATPSVSLTSHAPPPPSAHDSWALPSSSSPPRNPIGPISRDYSSNNNQHKDDNSSGSPGTSSSISITCFRCEERAPTTRCLECNDLYCHECCHSITSDCQLREHTLLPIHQVSPIGPAPRPPPPCDVTCELHAEPVRFYCASCVTLVCQECTLWMHKDHRYSPLRGALDTCRLNMLKALESGKAGTKAIKGAIDRAVAISKAFEKETAEVSIKIKKAMRCFAQAIEDRERYLLDKVEKMRQMKMNELSDQMNSLRGILAGLAHTNETLVKCLDLEGIDLFMAKEKGMAQIEYFACMYKSLQPRDDSLVFLPPNYELLEQLKRQCEVLPGGAAPPAPAYPPAPPAPDHSSLSSRLLSYYEGHGAGAAAGEARGAGQAIPGYWMAVTVKPTRSAVPGVPVLSFGREGQGEGEVSRPWGLCVDRDGNIIVADRRNNRIQIFSSRGEFRSMFGCKGTGPGEFDLPAGITTDVFGRIIVIDKDNHRVQVFTSAGHFILKFGSFGKECGQFQYPWDVAANSLGNLVVTDTRNHRIQLFTSDGTYITKLVFEGANPAKLLKGPTTPRGVCFTTGGNIIVSDFENHRLIMVDPTLSKVIHGVGREGAGVAELNRPSGIVTDDEGRVIVADSKNHRVLVFTSDLRYLWAVDLKSPGLDDKDRPSDVALTPDGYLVVLFETLPDTARDVSSHGKQYIKVY